MSDLIEQKWFLLGQPWCHSSDYGMTILAGSEDPHGGTFICDLQDATDDMDDDTARSLAKHIVDLHNAGLDHRE